MDDIRRPQHLKRRDYSIPAGRSAVPHSQDNPKPSASASAHHLPASHAPAIPVSHQPTYNQPVPQPVQASASPTSKTRKIFFLKGKRLSIIAGLILAGAAIFGAGYLLKGSNDANSIPASITRQVNYDLYFPSPMPPGYIYMKETATFQIGQVFYKFANDKKRVTVNEQPLPDPKPDLSKLPGYTQFQSSAGPAAIGTDLGEPTAVVITPTTIITMHCIGGVSADDLKTAINNLKNIGQKT